MKNRQRSRRAVLSYMTLEGRVVMSHGGFGGFFGGDGPFLGGASLVGGLSSLGVVTLGNAGFGQGRDDRSDGPETTSPQRTQLAQDQTTLATELKAIAAKSGVTLADLNSLSSDTRAIFQSGFRPAAPALQKAIGEIATAVAAGADSIRAKADFTAVFSGSTVAQTAIDKAYADIVLTVTDSHVTPTDLQTIAKDRAAIQADLRALPVGNFGDFQRGPGGIVGNLAMLGVVTGKGGGFGERQGDHQHEHEGGGDRDADTISNPQLAKDQAALTADLKALAAKSGVTVADLSALAADSHAIALANFTPDRTALQKAVGEIATAVAAGADATRAKADFTAVFSGSTVAQTAIDKAYADIVLTVTDSHVTPTDLQTIAKDRAAIQADLIAQPSITTTATSSGHAAGHAHRRAGSFGRRRR